jgi:hypothetical protein
MKRPYLRISLACAGALVIGALTATGEAQSIRDIPIEKLMEKATAGDSRSQYLLGLAYSSGINVPKDSREAMIWYEKAADQGEINSMVAMGEGFENGLAGPKDISKAIEWYERAIAQVPQGGGRAGYALARLSRAGLTKTKYGMIPAESGGFWTLDSTTPTKKLVQQLAEHTELVFTGKGYWIGYNQHMLSIAARRDEALPLLESFVRNAKSLEEKRAGLYTIHLIGIDSEVIGRFEENFRNRKARETLWRLMKIEELTDPICRLLKRDPWPADIPAIMEALSVVKVECPATLNSLKRYAMPGCPLDNVPKSEAEGQLSFTYQSLRSDLDVPYAIEGLRSHPRFEIVMEPDTQAELRAARPGAVMEQKTWKGTVSELLSAIKDVPPPFDYVFDGNPVFFAFESKVGSFPHDVTVRIFGPGSARAFVLKWWNEQGRDRYCHTLPDTKVPSR